MALTRKTPTEGDHRDGRRSDQPMWTIAVVV